MRGSIITRVDESLPSTWKAFRLAEVSIVTPSNVDKRIDSKEIHVKLCNYMDVYNNDYISSHLEYASGSATSSEINKFLLRKGDVLITKDSETKEDIARAAVVTEDLNDVLCGYHLALIRPVSSKIDGTFLAKLFDVSAVRKQLINKANGTTRFGLNVGTIEDLIIPVPQLDEQQKIAEILSTVDERIEVIEAQIAKTEELKKGLMQRLLKKGIGHTTFKNTPLGEIPENWECLKLAEIADVVRGGSPRPAGSPLLFNGDFLP